MDPNRYRFRRSYRGGVVLLAVTLFCFFFAIPDAFCERVAVRYREGVTHGFLLLKTVDGRILAVGDLLQTATADKVTSELVFHFRDGSVHDETAVFTQDQTFRLLSDKLVQKGPSFPHPVDAFIDCVKNEFTFHGSGKGEEKSGAQHIELPDDLANGMFFILLRNLSSSSPETKVSMLTASSKPRVVKISIVPAGERMFSVAGSKRKATAFDLKFEIGGVQGVIAPLIGKKPPDIHAWMSAGPSPTFVRFEGPLYEGGPIWRIDLANVAVAANDVRHGQGTPKGSKRK